MDEAWVKGIRAQCKAAKVPFFFKQWGGVRKSEAGRELDGRAYDDMPARTSHSAPARADRMAMIAEVGSWTTGSAIFELPVPVNLPRHTSLL
jgi:hypothetical protein